MEQWSLFGSTIKLTDKTKNGEKVSSLEVVEVFLVQHNLVDNQYQRTSEVLYTFTPNKPYAYLSIIKPSNLVFSKIYNTEFNEIIITFTDQSDRPSEIEERYSIKVTTRKHVKEYAFLSFAKNITNSYWIQD